MKKLSYLLISIFLSLVFISNSYAVESVDSSLKIYDYGELLTDEQEVKIKSKIDDYIAKYNLDMVIVTKKNYYGNLKAYGQDFYDYNDFGKGKTHDGILLVLNVDNYGPIAEIVTTGEGIRMYDDARIDSILTSMSNSKYSGNAAIVEAFVDKSDYYASLGIPASNKNTYIDENGDYHVRRTYPAFALIFTSAVVATIVLLVMVHKNKMIKKAITAHNYLDYNSIAITMRNDQFIHTHTTKTNISSNSGGHSGRGGSSISRGSSGRSHGGGGRRL